jgi:intracellular sulfur oxidation DsrE/DsrF family protein
MRQFRTAWIASVLVAALSVWPASAQQSARPPGAAQSTWVKTHRVVIQVTQNDPAVMNLALNNAENLAKYYKDKGEKFDIEFVAYGAGLSMMRSDTSPVKDRLAAIAAGYKNITFSGCGNTLANQSKQENKDLTLVPQARVVPTGIARIVELEEQGWTYVRP